LRFGGFGSGGLRVHFLMETDVADAFFYSVFWDYDSGDVRAWFSYFFDCFVDLRLGFDVFWGGRVCCKDGVLNIREVKYKPTKNLITVLLLLENYLFTSKLAFTQCYLSLKERKVGFRDDISKTC